MSEFGLYSIDARLEKERVKSVLLVSQVLERYKEEWNEEQRQYVVLNKLRNREDSFAARAASKGIRVTPVLHSEMSSIKTSGPFDFIIIAGEVTYQSFSIAVKVRTLYPRVPLAVEFCETTYDGTAHRLMVKQAQHHKCEELLGSLVYLTGSPKSPRAIVFNH